MMLFVGYLLVITSAQVRGTYPSPRSVNQQSVVNETTTAVPRYDVSTTIKNGHTPSATTLMPTTKQQTTTATYNSASSILSRLTSIATAPTFLTSTVNKQGIDRHDFITTTAAPPFTGPTPSYRQFDALSFAGGALLTISLVILGTYGWKMYMARIERSYWTL